MLSVENLAGFLHGLAQPQVNSFITTKKWYFHAVKLMLQIKNDRCDSYFNFCIF